MAILSGNYNYKSIELLGSQLDLYSIEDEIGSINFRNLVVHDSYTGPTSFDHTVIDFHEFFLNSIKKSLPLSKLNTLISDSDWFYQVGKRSLVKKAMESITSIANTPLAVIRDEMLDVVYREALTNLCMELGKYVDTFSLEDELTLVPLRGGLLVATLLPGFDLRRVVPIDCKRIPMKDKMGHFCFGMSFRYFSDLNREILKRRYIKKHKSLQILEVAVGSGITTAGMMIDMYERNILPDRIRVIAPVVTLPGIELVKRVADKLDVRIAIYTTMCYPSLGDFYHDRNDSVVDYKGDYVIGNASKILEPFLHLGDLDVLFTGTDRISRI